MLVGGGVIGLLASMVLAIEEVRLLQNPDYSPSCNISPVISCGSVMLTEQASVFGIPNTFLGIAGFGMLVMLGLALLAGAAFKRWLWLGAQAAATVGVVFMHYLFSQAVYSLGSICPWCFVVWMITIPVFWALSIHNIRSQYIKLPPRLAAFVSRHAGDILGLWYVAVFLILLTNFWYYWETFLLAGLRRLFTGVPLSRCYSKARRIVCIVA